MKRRIRHLSASAALAALAWVFAPLPGAAATTCDQMMASFRVPQPETPMLGTNVVTLADCSPAQMAMFRANLNAAKAAEPVRDSAQLYGTWLGDDVLDYVAGVTVPGQEVLVIGPGDVPGRIAFRQYWIKGSVPAGPESLWDKTGGYLGLLTEGVLDPKRDAPGSYGVQPFPEVPMIRYHHPDLDWERSGNLGVWERLNHFELPLTFALAGDVLVARTQKRTWPTRETSPGLVTYSKVAEGAPELAILMIQMLEISQAKNFDCLTHQISEGQGPLNQALAPFTLAQVREELLAQLNLLQERRVILDKIGMKDMTDDQKDRMQAVMEKFHDHMQAPVFEALKEVAPGGTVVGCYDFY